MYEKQLQALKRAGRLRKRDIFNTSYTDLASNDYLDLAANKKTLAQTCELLHSLTYHAPKASQLVNGYHPIHEEFERALCFKNGFEKGMIVGSGYLANLALLESLVRKEDTLLLDEKYHASGVMASRLAQGRVEFFKHNDCADLEKRLKAVQKGRRIIAVEGVYSMDGDVMEKAIFALAARYDALLIVDEAHSSGVLGRNLNGVFDHYGIRPEANHVKMGTLGKAYGSYGAYILASKQLIAYLENRAKSVIYTTAPSLFDTAQGYYNFHYIQKNSKKLRKKLDKRMAFFGSQSLIVPIPCRDNQTLLALQEKLKSEGIIVGAIRKPTVKHPMIRLIPKLGVKMKIVKKAVGIIEQSDEHLCGATPRKKER